MTRRVLVGYLGRGLAIALVVSAIGVTSAARSARGEAKPYGRVYSVRNESGLARTISVADFHVFAHDNPFTPRSA